MTGVDHERNKTVVVAAQWLAEQKKRPTPLVPALRSRFDLTAVEACEAMALAGRFLVYRKAFG